MTREPTGALRRGLPWTRDRGWGATNGAPSLTVPHGDALLPFGHALLTTVALRRFPEKLVGHGALWDAAIRARSRPRGRCPLHRHDRVHKMVLRRAAMAARAKEQAGDVDTSPTDARATAREAAQTLVSMGGDSDEDDDNVEMETAPAQAPTRKTNGKRPAAAGLAMSAAKARRWAPAPPSAFLDPSPALFVSAAHVAPPQSTEAIAPLSSVHSGPSRLVGPPAPGAPAGPSGRQSPSGDGTSAVASAVGLREVHAGVSLRTALGSARGAVTPTPTSTTAATRVQVGPRSLAQERPVVLGVRRRTHHVPTLRVSQLMTGPSTAAARRAAVLSTPARSASAPVAAPSSSALPVAPAARVPPTAPAHILAPTEPPPRASLMASADSAPRFPVGGSGAPEAGPGRAAVAGLAADPSADVFNAGSPGPRRPRAVASLAAATASVEFVNAGRPAARPPVSTAGGVAMEAPVFRMMGSTTGGGAAAPSSGSVASSAATLSGAGSYPDPSGPDVQLPTTAAAQATVDPLAAALGPGHRGERRAKILENAVWAATSSVRVDVAAMASAVTVMKDTLVGMKTKLDSDIQLSQQTLGRLAAVEKTVLDGIKSAVSLGHLGNSGEDDEETSKKEKLIKLVTKKYRDVLIDDFATAVKTVLVFSCSDDNWDTLVVSVDAVQKQGLKAAEEWLKSFVRRSSRRNPTIFANIRVSLLALRVKPHLHQVWTDVIVGGYFEALDLDLDTLTNEMALELLANDSFFLSSRGRQACLDALSKLFMSVGAADRVKQPDGPLGPRVVSATLGHFALVVTKVRNALEIAAGTRSSARGGAIGDGHFPLWVAEVRRLVPTQAADAEAHDGLVLVDGADPARSLPQF